MIFICVIMQTQSLGDNTALEEEMNVLWEDTWRRGRLDIASTKQVARLFEIGGATVVCDRAGGEDGEPGVQ